MLPGHTLLTSLGSDHIAQPLPARLNISFRYKDLIEALRAPFAAHQRAIRFCECACGKRECAPYRSLIQQMVEHDHIPRAAQKRVDRSHRRSAVEVVFEDH